MNASAGVDRPRRGRASTAARRNLVAGGIILTAVLIANIAAYLIPAERSQLDFRHEPWQFSWLQSTLWPNDAPRDTVIHILGLSDSVPDPVRIFSTVPPRTARKGKRYEYHPRSGFTLTDYSLQGTIPDGITVDSANGLVSGVPQSVGKYAVVLAAKLDNDRHVEQRFTLFIDNRRLVLGADGMGRSIFGRLAASAEYTIIPGLIAVMIGVAGGALVGGLAGFYAGATQRGLQAITTIMQSIPGLLIIFLAGAISQYNVYILMVVVGLILLPETANGVFERVESFRKRDFVEAARELGMRDRRILWNEIVWHNARPYLLTKVTQGFVFAILVEVTLSYLTLTDSSLPQIGGMLLDGRNAFIERSSYVVGLTSLAALLFVIAGFSLTEKGILGMWERRR